MKKGLLCGLIDMPTTQQNSENLKRGGENIFLLFWLGESVKNVGEDKIFKSGGRTKRGNQDFLEKLQGETNLGRHCKYFELT